jgi:hypothetical protein
MTVDDRSVSEYQLDHDDRIVALSHAFLAFAVQNDTPEITTAALVGRPIWDFVAGVTTRELYAALFQHVRLRQQPVRFPFRCDSPTRRRFMEMEVFPEPDLALRLAAIVVRSEDRPPVALLDPRVSHSDVVLEACSFCRAIRVADDRWLPAEDAVSALALFEARQLPLLSHGVCPACLPELRRRLQL